MGRSKAFVGHSFNPADQPAVDAILRALDVVKSVTPGFSWVHAEQPEARQVAEKVLALFEGCDTFIGICTRKERVLEEGSPSSFFGKLIVGKNTLIWKTSDWVIQEIGLAVGRGLRTILLIEEGVRRPGGLQGDVEYIPFRREAPNDVLEKLLLMVSGRGTSASDASTGTEPQEVSKDSAVSEALVDTVSDAEDRRPFFPLEDRQDYELAMLYSKLTKNVTETEEVDRAFRASQYLIEDGSDVRWVAYQEYAKVVTGAQQDLRSLKNMAEADPQNVHIAEYLARAYNYLEEPLKAALQFELAAEQCEPGGGKLELLGYAAKAYQKAGESDSARAIIDRMRAQVNEEGNGNDVLLATQLSVAEQSNDDYLAIAALEQILDTSPADADQRFDLAYKYSQVANTRLAAYHYSRIPAANRTGMAWNNFGVALDSLKLPAMAVDAYRRAESAGETLAMANLAYKFLGAGFLAEARSICEEAKKVTDYHANVDKAVVRLRDVPTEEEKSVGEIYASAKLVSDFNRKVGAALASPAPQGLPPQLRDPHCVLDVRLNGAVFEATGTFKRRGLSSILGGEGSEVSLVRQYKGELQGRVIFGTVSSDSGRNTLLSMSAPTKILAVVLPDMTLEVMELSDATPPKIYPLKAVGS